MENIVKEISNLFQFYSKNLEDRIEQLPQSGGDRIYFRIFSGEQTYIATYNCNIPENETFFYCTKHFRSKGLPVPEIFAVNEQKTIYLQEDLGTQNLLEKLEKDGYTDELYDLYKQALQQLAKLQIDGNENFNYNQCFGAKMFGRQAIMNDLLYFKYYFLDTLKLDYDREALTQDFETLSNYPDNDEPKYFMYRDFQGRNVIVNDGKVYFIDYQGGMKGPMQYDVASLLWQAKAELSHEWKERLLSEYISEAEQNIGSLFNRPAFISLYNAYVLIRLLQVLGAYGFRGLFERKAHFIGSIPVALRNLSFFINNTKLEVLIPELYRILKAIGSEEIISKFETVKATAQTPLVVKIYSFSYKQNLPKDDTENGGGFLFDMRGILNPGRFEAFKKLTGRDKTVKDFLEQKTKIKEFLNGVFITVDITVEDYIKRNFENLLVGFGCTGGQHRSVYAADELAKHLKNKFDVKVEVQHMVQDAKNWMN